MRSSPLLFVLLSGIVGTISSACAGPGGSPSTVVQRHSSPVTVAASSDGIANATCTSGEQMLGGGYLLSEHEVVPSLNAPSGSAIWKVSVHNPLASAFQVTAFADCLQASFSAGSTIVTSTPGLLEGGFVQAGAPCPSGAVVTGGGFEMTPPDAGYVWVSRPALRDFNAWIAKAMPLSGSVTLQAYAICASAHLSDPLTTTPHPTFDFPIGGATFAQSTAPCPPGQVLTQGGFEDRDALDASGLTLVRPPVRVNLDAPTVDAADTVGTIASWDVGGYNGYHGYADRTHTETLWLVCLLTDGSGTPGSPGSEPTPTGLLTASPTAIASPTSPVPPVSVFGAGPQSFTQTCQSSFTVLPPLQVQLNNARSTVPVTWSASITETVGTSGHVWATASPPSGSVAAGATQTLTVTPESGLCNDSQNVVPDATYHVRLTFSPASELGGTIAISDGVRSPVPG
jgi:hypothetical protein